MKTSPQSHKSPQSLHATLSPLLSKPFNTFLLLFALLSLRYLAFGFQYFPSLDDYIQHGNYATGNLWQLIREEGLLTVRPLAHLLDVTLWGQLFDNMILGVLLIALLYAASALFFYQLLSRFFTITPLFLVIYTLLPLGFEGTYWMSASTRVIPGLFFASLSALALDEFYTKGAKKHFFLFLLAQSLCFGFYEQCIILSVTLTAMLFLHHSYEKNPRWYAGLFFVIPCILYFVVTRLTPSHPVFSSRTSFILPSPYYFNVFLPELLSQLKQAFLSAGFYTWVKGFARGLPYLLSLSGMVYLFLTCGFSALLQFVPSHHKESGKTFTLRKKGKKLLQLNPYLSGIFVGFLLFLAPISLFFVLENPWFGLRNTVCSYCGIALMIDSVFSSWSKSSDIQKKAHQLVTFLLATTCTIASISQLADYKDTYYNDLQVASTLFPEISAFPSSYNIGILGVEPSFLEDQNYFYHEHIHGVTESNWALTGRVIYYGSQEVATLNPLPIQNPAYAPYLAESRRPTVFDVLYYYDHQNASLTPLTVEEISPELYHFHLENGDLFAILEETDRTGTITLS